ncbi:MAG: putative cytokinetic ring protein SteA [Actinomycetota bacterium]
MRRFRRRTTLASGTARIDRRTKNLLHRIRSGEIAVIDHEDLDQAAAEGLVQRSVAAVLNARASVSGTYPNAGPMVLERAGIPLVDVGPEILATLKDGDEVSIAEDGTVERGGVTVATGTILRGEALAAAMKVAYRNLGDTLERFVRNTADYLERERDLILEGTGVPEIRTQIEGRDAVIVVRGNEHRADLQTLRPYLREQRPVMVAVDGAADALLDLGYRPDIIVGDMDSVSSEALTCGAELIVHAYPDGRAPGLDRIHALGLQAVVFPSIGTSEDLALLLAYEKGANLLVAVGAHDNLVEFLDKGRAGMASTFVVRLKVGPKLVDAKGVNRLYRSSVRSRDLIAFVVTASAAMVTAAMIFPGPRLFVRQTLDLMVEAFRSVFG